MKRLPFQVLMEKKFYTMEKTLCKFSFILKFLEILTLLLEELLKTSKLFMTKHS